jgi:hypothetical protein
VESFPLSQCSGISGAYSKPQKLIGIIGISVIMVIINLNVHYKKWDEKEN